MTGFRHIANRRSLIAPLVVAAAVTLFQALPAGQRSDTEGIKETENFVKAGDKTMKSIGDAKTQIQATLTAYNALVTQPSTNMKGDYKKLLKAVKQMDDKVTDARTNVSAMDKLGDTYFAGRAASIKNIQSADLMGQAQKRLDATQSAYSDVRKSFRESAEALEPVRKDLEDQIHYLGSDLSPSGTASLKPQAEKLNQRGTEAFAKIDQSMGTATSYFDSLRPAKS